MGKMPTARPASHRLRLPSIGKTVKFPKIAAGAQVTAQKAPATATLIKRGPRRQTTATNDAILET